MFHLLHKWEKWSKITTERWTWNGPKPHEYVREVQQRSCSKCGKIQKRYFD